MFWLKQKTKKMIAKTIQELWDFELPIKSWLLPKITSEFTSVIIEILDSKQKELRLYSALTDEALVHLCNCSSLQSLVLLFVLNTNFLLIPKQLILELALQSRVEFHYVLCSTINRFNFPLSWSGRNETWYSV